MRPSPPGRNRLLVFGGRGYWNRRFLEKTLDEVLAEAPIAALIHGDAGDLNEDGSVRRGADKLAGAWAAARGIPVLPFPADWCRGRKAGPERNARMLREGRPTASLGFKGGRGSADMARRCRDAGVPLTLVPEPPYLVRVVGPDFVAGMVIENEVCIEAAPILQSALCARGKIRPLLSAEIEGRGWKASIVVPP